MFSLSELKAIYQNNRKLVNAITIVIILLIIALIVVLAIKPPAATENSKFGTVGPAKVANGELGNQLSELHGIIKKTYGEKLNGYEIADGELLEDGSWYITTFSKPTDRWSLAEDTYRIILHKADDGSWQIVAGPELIFSYLEYPDIPKPVIFSANNL